MPTMISVKKRGKCVICGGTYEHWGNNAEPLANGRCCDNCNIKVIAERIKIAFNRKKKKKLTVTTAKVNRKYPDDYPNGV